MPRSAVSPAEFETFDQNLSDAVDGAGGGAYAPSATIEIGGSGLEVSGPFVSSGDFTAQDSATFGGVSVATLKATRVIAGVARYTINSGGSYAGSATIAITEAYADTGFVLASDTIEVPEAGLYLVCVSVLATSTNASDPARIGARVVTDPGGADTSVLKARSYRHSTDTGDVAQANAVGLAIVTTPATDTIRLLSDVDSGSLSVVTDAGNHIVIVRISA